MGIKFINSYLLQVQARSVDLVPSLNVYDSYFQQKRKVKVGKKQLGHRKLCFLFQMALLRSDHWRTNVHKAPYQIVSAHLTLSSYQCHGVDPTMNKAGYTAAPVACGWAGAVLKKVTRAFGQEQLAQKAQTCQKTKKGTDGPTDGPTDQRTNGPT